MEVTDTYQDIIAPQGERESNTPLWPARNRRQKSHFHQRNYEIVGYSHFFPSADSSDAPVEESYLSSANESDDVGEPPRIRTQLFLSELATQMHEIERSDRLAARKTLEDKVSARMSIVSAIPEEEKDRLRVRRHLLKKDMPAEVYVMKGNRKCVDMLLTHSLNSKEETLELSDFRLC